MPIKSNVTGQQQSGRDRFKRVIPLLSRGYSFPTAFPDGNLTVLPWTSKTDEFLLARSRKGKKNTILFDLLPQLCELNGCPPANFVLGEINLVLLVSRSISRQNRMQLDMRCPNCQHRMQQEITIPDQLERIGEKSEGYPGYDLIILPESMDEVAVRPLLVQDELDIENREHKQIGDVVSRVLCAVVTVGDGKPDNMGELLGWFDRLSPTDSEFLASEQDRLSPHLSTILSVQCDECDEPFKHILRIDESFFRPASRA